MKDRLICIALFVYILSLYVFSFYTDYRMNQVEVYEPSNPILLSVILWLTVLVRRYLPKDPKNISYGYWY